jgi:hypothetical protein
MSNRQHQTNKLKDRLMQKLEDKNFKTDDKVSFDFDITSYN